MAYMRSTIAFGLFWMNLIAISLIIYFSVNINKESDLDYYSSNKKINHLRGTKENKENDQNKNLILSSLLSSSLEQKKIRNLFSNSKDYKNYIIYIDSVSYFFLMILMFSFCLTENECCTSDANANRDFAVGSCYGTCVCCNECHCSSSGGNNCDCNGDGAIGLLIILLCILVFVAIYFLLKACGKHIARLCSVSILAFLDLAIVILCIMIGMDYKFDIFCSLTLVISLIGFICNLLGIILPNLGNCQKLRYGYMYVDNSAQNNLQVQDINTTLPSNIITPAEQPLAPAYGQNNGYDNTTDGNIYGAPPPSSGDNYYNYGNNYYPYPSEQQVYNNANPCPQ